MVSPVPLAGALPGTSNISSGGAVWYLVPPCCLVPPIPLAGALLGTSSTFGWGAAWYLQYLWRGRCLVPPVHLAGALPGTSCTSGGGPAWYLHYLWRRPALYLQYLWLGRCLVPPVPLAGALPGDLQSLSALLAAPPTHTTYKHGYSQLGTRATVIEVTWLFLVPWLCTRQNLRTFPRVEFNEFQRCVNLDYSFDCPWGSEKDSIKNVSGFDFWKSRLRGNNSNESCLRS